MTRPSLWRRVVLVAVFGFIAWRLTNALQRTPTSADNSAKADVANREYFVGITMGCSVTITIDSEDPVKSKLAAREALLTLDALDATLSDWKADSELSKWNSSGELRADASDEMRTVLASALEVAAATEGRFDPTLAPCVMLWRTSRESRELPSEADLSAAREHCGWQALTIDGASIVRAKSGMRLDFGGIGKGYAAVRALETLRANGFPRAIVAIAGDIAVGEPPRGEPGWKVDVASANGAIPLRVSHCALSTSGASEQWVEIDGQRYAHIVDPRTGLGATHLAQVSVIGPLDARVDALATALALCESAEEINAILAKFPAFGALSQRDGVSTTLGAWDSTARVP